MEIYLSPYRLLGNVYNPDLVQEKEKLIAKLKNSSELFLIIEGAEYNLDTIESSFISLSDKKEYEYHRAIYLNKELLNFLENKQGDYSRLLSALRWGSMNAGLKEFVLPFFSLSYQLFIKDAIQRADLSALMRYIDFETFLTPEYLNKSNIKIATAFDDLIEKLKSIRNSDGNDFSYKEVETYISKNILLCFDTLSEYFQPKKKEYQEELVKFAAFLNTIGNDSTAKEIAKNLISTGCQLELPESLSVVTPELNKKEVLVAETKNNRILLYLIPSLVIITVILIFALKPKQVQFKGNSDFEINSGRQSNFISVVNLSKSLKEYYKPYPESNLVRYYYAQRYNDLIEQTPEDQIIRRNVKRSKPYRRLLGDDEFIDTNNVFQDLQKFVKIENNCDYDVVIFFVRDGSKVAAHSYVYSGDLKMLEFQPQYKGEGKDYDIYAYVGKDWNDFYRIRVGEGGLNGMFEFQPKCYSGLKFTNIKVGCQTIGENQVKNYIIEINKESNDCPVQISARDTLVYLP